MRSSHHFSKFMSFAAVAVFALSACNYKPPITEDSVKPKTWYGARNTMATLASRPESRLSFINVAEGTPRYASMCSEPPADAAASISSTFQGGLEVNAGNDQGGKAELASTLATAIQALTQRSQGVVLFRDASFRYCEAYLNGLLGKKDYFAEIKGLYTDAKLLIEKELDTNGGKIGHGPFLPLTAPTQRKLVSLLTGADQEEDDTPAGDDDAAPNDAD